MARFGLLFGCLLLAMAGFSHVLSAGEESEDAIRDRLEKRFNIKGAIAKPNDGRRVIKDLFDHLQKLKSAPVESKLILDSIIQIGTQDEKNLDLVRTAAGMWIQAYKFDPYECYDHYIDNIKALRDRGRVDKDSAAIEMVFLRNDEVNLYLQSGNYSKALKLATDNKAFTDAQPDRDLRAFAANVLADVTRREKSDRRKTELAAALSPDEDSPDGNAKIAEFLVLEAADLSPDARSFMLKSADELYTALAKLLDARDSKQALGCRDLLRLGELAYALNKKAVSDEAKEALLKVAETAFNDAAQHPEAKTLTDPANLPLNLYIEHNAQTKVAADLSALRRKNQNRTDSANYLFSHVSFFAPIDRPLGDGWSYRKDQDHSWVPDGPTITYLSGDGRLNCKTKLSGDFTLCFDLLPLTEFQDKPTVLCAVYFNDNMKSGLSVTKGDNNLKTLFDFGTSKSGPVIQNLGNYTGWTHWEIKQRNGTVAISVNNRPLFNSSGKLPTVIEGEFSFGSEPLCPFQLRNIRLKSDN